jgi:hypothetical protein
VASWRHAQPNPTQSNPIQSNSQTNEDLVLLVSFFLEVASMKDTVDPSVRTAALQHVINVTYTCVAVV